MAPTTLPLTHYWPWDGDEQKAVCGTPMHGDTTRHSLNPTCAVCAAALAAADDRIDEAVELTLLPLDAAEAADMSPVGADALRAGRILEPPLRRRPPRGRGARLRAGGSQLMLKGVRR